MSEENTVMEPIVAPEQVIEQPKQEKLMTMEEVNSLVGIKKAQAAEKVRKELQEQYQREIEQLRQQSQPHYSDVDSIVEQKLKEREEAAMQARMHEGVKKIAENFSSKMSSFKPSEDFEDETGFISAPHKYPEVIFLVTELDNTAEVAQELAKSASKMGNIDYWAKKDPDVARKMLQKLSKSISQNKAAASEASKTAAPLSQLKPSTVGSSSGKMGLQDFKKASWLRG